MPARRENRQDTIPDMARIGRATTTTMRNWLVLVIAACGSPSVAPRPPAIVPVDVAPAVPTAWNLAFERACRGSNTTPFASPDQKYIGLCDALFTYDTGEYAGALPIGATAFLAGDAVLSESFRGAGLEIDPIPGTAATRSRSFGTGMGRGTVIAPDRTRALTVIEDRSQRSLTLVALPTLEKLDAVRLDPGERELGFLADGTPIIHAAGVVSRLVGGTLVPLTAPRGIERITVASGGTRAVITRAGRRAVVELPTWRELVALPPPGENEVRPDEALALTARGDRVAFTTGPYLIIAAIDPRRGLVELHRRAFGMAEGLAFSPDGRTLLARNHNTLEVLREGAPRRDPFDPEYDPVLLKGVSQTYQRGGVGDAGDGIEHHDGGEELLPAGAFARWRDDDTTVTAFATDAGELGTSATSLDVWAQRVLARHGDTAARSKRWQTATGRALEYATFVRDGCDPVDRYIHVEERDGIVVRVEIEVPPGWPRKKVLPRLETFFDRAFGAPNKRELAAAPPPPRGGC